jgi:hypothetical protein
VIRNHTLELPDRVCAGRPHFAHDSNPVIHRLKPEATKADEIE